MANEFEDGLDRLERQHVNYNGRIQIKPVQRECNVNRVVRQVNTNIDAFVADNTDMSDVDFEDVSIRHGESFGQQQNYHLS
jgi:hypothetical protein